MVGVYLLPPQNAVVLFVDEKSQIQAQDRTQPGLPPQARPLWHPGPRPTAPPRHHLVYHSLGDRRSSDRRMLAARPPSGVPGVSPQIRRRVSGREGPAPDHRQLRTHGHASVRRWLAKHSRFVLHFIPTSSSWLNPIEHQLSQKAVRRGVFRRGLDPERCIGEFLAAWNTNPTPFMCTASVEHILEKIVRTRQRLERIKLGCPNGFAHKRIITDRRSTGSRSSVRGARDRLRVRRVGFLNQLRPRQGWRRSGWRNSFRGLRPRCAR